MFWPGLYGLRSKIGPRSTQKSSTLDFDFY
jgi:hypothetical protein